MLNPALFENMFKNKDLWGAMKVMGEIDGISGLGVGHVIDVTRGSKDGLLNV